MNKKAIALGILAVLIFVIFANCSDGENFKITDTSPAATPDVSEEPPKTSTVGTPATTELPPNSFMPEISRISIHEVKSKLDSGINIAIVDSRGQKYYDKAHIIGAICLPLDDMTEPCTDLDGYDEITTYCA